MIPRTYRMLTQTYMWQGFASRLPSHADELGGRVSAWILATMRPMGARIRQAIQAETVSRRAGLRLWYGGRGGTDSRDRPPVGVALVVAILRVVPVVTIMQPPGYTLTPRADVITVRRGSLPLLIKIDSFYLSIYHPRT